MSYFDGGCDSLIVNRFGREKSNQKIGLAQLGFKLLNPVGALVRNRIDNKIVLPAQGLKYLLGDRFIRFDVGPVTDKNVDLIVGLLFLIAGRVVLFSPGQEKLNL